MKSINLKNQIMTPSVLNAYRSGNLSYKTMQDTSSPLEEIYTKTYSYLDYPDLSPEGKALVALASQKQTSSFRNENNDIAYRVSQAILPIKR